MCVNNPSPYIHIHIFAGGAAAAAGWRMPILCQWWQAGIFLTFHDIRLAGWLAGGGFCIQYSYETRFACLQLFACLLTAK